MSPDRGDKIRERRARVTGLDNQPLGRRAKHSRALVCVTTRDVADGRADTRPHDEEPLFEEKADDAMRRVRVDFELAAEFSNRRELVTGPKLPAYDRVFDGIDNLLVDGFAHAENDGEGQHGVLARIIQLRLPGGK